MKSYYLWFQKGRKQMYEEQYYLSKDVSSPRAPLLLTDPYYWQDNCFLCYSLFQYLTVYNKRH